MTGAAGVADAADPESADIVDNPAALAAEVDRTAALAAEMEGAAAMAGTIEGANEGHEMAAGDKAGVDTDADEIGAKTVMGVNKDEDEVKVTVVVVCVKVEVIV